MTLQSSKPVARDTVVAIQLRYDDGCEVIVRRVNADTAVHEGSRSCIVLRTWKNRPGHQMYLACLTYPQRGRALHGRL